VTRIGRVAIGLDETRGSHCDVEAGHPSGPQYDRIADVEVFWSAVHNQIEHNERTDLARANRALQMGFDRADQLALGQTPWVSQNGIHGFYSKIDGSAQPYILNVPEDFDPADRQRRRLDVFLHGRDEGTYDLNFMFTKSTTNFNGMPLKPALDRFILSRSAATATPAGSPAKPTCWKPSTRSSRPIVSTITASS